MDEARSLQYSINVTANTDSAEGSLRNLTSSLGGLKDSRVNIGADTSQAEGGIRRVTSSLGNVKTEATSVGSAFRKSFLAGIDSGDSLASSLKQGVGGAFAHVKGQVSDFKSNVVNAASSIKEGFQHPIETIKNGLGNAAQAAKNKIVDMARGADSSLDEVADSADDAEKQIDEMGDAADRAGGKFGGLSGIMKGVGAAAAAAVGAVVAVGKAAIDAGMEYETAFAQVHTIMDTNQMSTEDMSSSIKKLSSEMGISASEISNTVYNAISATGDTANAVNLAEQASKLATAGFTDTSSALGVLTTAMNAYGLSAEEAEQISSSLIMVQNLGVTTVADLSSNMGRAIASASAYGVDLSNLESAYISITKAGISTAEGTTYISAMMQELGNSTSTVAKVLKEKTGKSFDQLMAEGKSLGDVLGVLQDSVNGDSTALMNLWSTATAGKASAAIVGQGLDTFNENLLAVKDSAGATEEAYGIMADTLAHKTAVFKTTGQNLLSSIYTGMSGKLGEIMDFANGAMTQLADAFEEGGIPALMGALGNVLSEGLNMVIGMLPDVIDAGMQLLGALGQGILDNLPVLVEAAAQIVVTLATKIADSLPTLVPALVETAITIVETLLDNLPLIIDAGLQLLQGLAEGIVNALPVLIGKLPEIINKIIGFVTDNLPVIIQMGVQILSTLADGIIQAIPLLLAQLPSIIESLCTFFYDSLPTILEQGINIVINLAMGIIEAIPDLVAQLPEIIGSICSFMTENLPTFVEQGINMVINLAMGIIEAIPQLLGQLPLIISSIVDTITSNLPAIIEMGVELLIKLAEGIISAIPQLVAQLPAIISAIVQGLGALIGGIVDVGKSIVEGLWRGISNAASWLWDKITGWASGILDGIKGFFGIHSPSTVFAGIGGFMAMGLGEGFVDEMDDVEKDMEGSIPTDFASDITYGVNAVVGDVNTPKVNDVSYNVTPIAGDFNPPNASADLIYSASSEEVTAATVVSDAALEGSSGGGAPAFAPVININVSGGVDPEAVEDMRSTLYDTVRELFQEFRDEELERMTLKNQYAY